MKVQGAVVFEMKVQGAVVFVGAVVFEVKMRFCDSPTTTRLEDASVEWRSELVSIARLTLQVQGAVVLTRSSSS
jgi:hypothetical protein